MKLSLDHLKNKENPDVQRILRLSFVYLITSISKEYSSLNGYKTINEFNEKNRIYLSKSLLYPFFISLANGSSSSLYALFGDFYSLSFGPVSFSVFNLLKESGDKLEYFDFEPQNNPVGLEIRPDPSWEVVKEKTPIENIFDKIKEDIKNTEITWQGDVTHFRSIVIDSDSKKIHSDEFIEKELFAAIESGISAIKRGSSSFFNTDNETMKLHASYYGAYKNRLANEEVSVIGYNEIEKGDSRPFYHDEVTVI